MIRKLLPLLLLAALATPALAQNSGDTGQLVKQPAGAIIVPDHFLRRWDPVTIFFAHPMGANPGAPDDNPAKLVTMAPAQPGAWTWLDGKTLQFRPATPWPPLSQFTFHIAGAGQDIQLSRLLDPATSTNPANGATGLEKMASLTLTVSEPLNAKALAGMLDIAFSPLPGLDPTQAQHLTQADFDIKTMERAAPANSATYVIEFHRPIPDGMAVTASIGLSAIPGLQGTVEQLNFSTADAFRPTLMGCASARVPLSANGTIYDKSSALACTTEQSTDQSNDQSSNTDSSDSGMDNAGADNNTDASDQSPPPPVPVADLATTTAKTPSIGTPDQQAAPATAQPAPPRQVVVEFSANPAAIDPVTARNFVRITPPVENVQTAINNNQLDITANFATGTLYQITLNPTPFTDTVGRPLAMAAPSAVWLYWPPEQNFLSLSAGNGVVERYGPQMIPLSGRGYSQADIRIHAINPLDRSFWPFPAAPIATNDNDRPPAPGEQPPPFTGPANIDTGGLQAQIARLGSPSISTLTPLPLKDGSSATFGLDLQNAFARIAGRNNPGSYLIGVRALDQPGQRSWMRVQVTDLSVTAVEEERAVRLVVTSLATGLPVAGATIEIDAVRDNKWTSIATGATGADGAYDWPVQPNNTASTPSRIVITKADDTLVIDPTQPPDRYTANGWSPGQNDWLSWTANSNLNDRHPAPQTLCHIFTERPIYRPTDPVHIKAFIRRLANGLLTPDGRTQDVELNITGPDQNAQWQYKLHPDGGGNVHYLFNDKTTATGLYTAELDVAGNQCATVNFKKDAYRLPKFQIRMNGPDQIPLDKPAAVGITALYYAGGPAAGRPVRWRVTQFPYGFAPAARPGFIYATDAMFEPSFAGQSTAALESQATTDKEGRASLNLDPTREPSNAPRRYVVEATVTGDDDKTVTNTQQILALPSFVIGLQAPRFLPHANAIPVQILMVDAKGNPIAGHPITLRLLRRQWSSILQESDFSDGKPKYQTEVVDEKLIERTIISGSDAVALNLPIDEAGVYIVELDAADDLGRLQTVSLDLFAAGSSPVTWSRPPATVFKVTTDKPAYVPGDTAKLILESPFQTAQALAIAEWPNGVNQYQWVKITNGYGIYSLPIDKSFMPRIPVHFVLMRGRLPGIENPTGPDLRRPETIAATAWVGVKPVKNIVTVALIAPPGALPGQTISLTVKLSDDTGKPVSGEVTLWLIDQAVLALAQEAPLNPLPDFIRDRASRVAFSDTRNWPFGSLPLSEDPGGDVGAGDQNLLNKVTIRKNFNPMPYYNPALVIGPSGAATVSIKLPDDLTIFKIRAVAISGSERFGFATGEIPVRLPVIIEPNLPRFVRPGDSFELSGIGRVVEGGGGAGQAQLAAAGLDISGPTTKKFDWQPNTPQNFGFPVTVPSPGYTPQGKLARASVTVTMAVERDSDKATDAFQVNLPIKPDRDPVNERVLADLTAPSPFTIPAITGAARPGTVRRAILLSTQPALVRLAAGLNYLQTYPFGCTEQRVSLARAELAAKDFSPALYQGGNDQLNGDVTDTLTWITSATDPSGLVAFWPGAAGNVYLTAWSLEFMVEAQKAGFTVDPVERATIIHALQQSLRSDYANFVSGGAYVERAWALAALAYAGELDRDYADELARELDQLSLEGVAQVSIALQDGGFSDAPIQKPLQDALWNGLVVKLRDGRQIYGGLQEGDDASTDYASIFPSETRTIAEMLRATAAGTDPRRHLLVDALIKLGGGNGWGGTNSNADALLALTAYLKSDTGGPTRQVDLTLPTGPQTLTLSGSQPLARVTLTDGGAIKIAAPTATAANPVSVQSDLTWLPAPDGSHVAPAANGFVVLADSDKILNNTPPTRTRLNHSGIELDYQVGDIVEDHVQLVNPEDRNYVAITIPLAAGMEPLNPSLATAPPEATPSAPPTLTPSYVAFLDDKVSYYYDFLPKGAYDFYFRTQAAIPGRFIQPAAQAVMMYSDSVTGGAAGALVVIAPVVVTPAPKP